MGATAHLGRDAGREPGAGHSAGLSGGKPVRLWALRELVEYLINFNTASVRDAAKAAGLSRLALAMELSSDLEDCTGMSFTVIRRLVQKTGMRKVQDFIDLLRSADTGLPPRQPDYSKPVHDWTLDQVAECILGESGSEGARTAAKDAGLHMLAMAMELAADLNGYNNVAIISKYVTKEGLVRVQDFLAVRHATCGAGG